jgi:alcohol dehydrogenase class IV
LELLGSSILAATSDGKSEKRAREKMLLGSMLAGISFANSPVAGVHALAYPLGVKYKVSHGLSNALLLPHVMKFNMQLINTRDSYAKLAGVIFPHLKDIKDAKEQANLLADEFIHLSKKLGLPTRLQEIDIPKDALTKLSSEAMKQDRLLINNPKKISQRDAEEIYKAAW